MIIDRKIVKSLDVPEAFLNAEQATLDKVCNGVGTARMNAKLRGVLTDIMFFIEQSAGIHDWEFTFAEPQNNRTNAKFNEVNWRFLLNGCREAGIIGTPVYVSHPLCYFAYLLCKVYGHNAYGVEPPGTTRVARPFITTALFIMLPVIILMITYVNKRKK